MLFLDCDVTFGLKMASLAHFTTNLAPRIEMMWQSHPGATLAIFTVTIIVYDNMAASMTTWLPP